jgi:hypothetical protein
LYAFGHTLAKCAFATHIAHLDEPQKNARMERLVKGGHDGLFQAFPCLRSLDLEIIDRVYEAVWAQIEARQIDRDTERDPERQQKLRERIFAVAEIGTVDFDALYERVIEALRLSETSLAPSAVSVDLRQPTTD